jgi:hypothetical protein
MVSGGFSQSYQIQWQNCIGGSNTDKVMDMIDVDNGYLLAGYTESFDGDVSFNRGYHDCWLININETGEIIWEKTYGGSGGDAIYKIFEALDGNYYLLCASSSSDGDISYDPYPESEDFWIVKVDSVGSILWEHIVGGSYGDKMWTGTATADGGIVAYGWTASNDGDISVYYGAYDTWMIKLSSKGEIEWDFTLGSPSMDSGQAIIQTSDSGFLCGSSSTIIEGGNINCEPFNHNAEAVVVKLDKARNIEWQRCLGGSDHDGTTALHEMTDGYLVSAYAYSNDGDVSGWHGDVDIWVLKLDFDGNIIWQNCYGGSKAEMSNSFLPSPNGDFHIVGCTSSNDGDVSGNHTMSEYDYDIWLIHVSSEGELLSQQCIGGRGDEQQWWGAIKKSEFSFVIASETNWGPSYDVQCMPHGGLTDVDIWVFEISDTTVQINEHAVQQEIINAYPNPAKDYVCFEYTGKQQLHSSQLTICNGQGAELNNPVIYNSGSKIVWDTRDVKPGVYFYTFIINGSGTTSKLVITK